jgi:predicted RNA-binding Zn-ribbon protein involved in translation (DUF1610 family)
MIGGDEKKPEKTIGEMIDPMDSRRSGVQCPRCGRVSISTWVLDNKHGLCLSCGNYWPIKESS